MLGFSTQHPTVSCGTERPHLPPLGPAGVTKSSPGMADCHETPFRPSVSTAKSRYFNNLRLPHQTHTPDVVFSAFSEAFFKGAIKMFQRDNEMKSIVLSDSDARDRATRHFFNRALWDVREGPRG